jgi:hypothetical protein
MCNGSGGGAWRQCLPVRIGHSFLEPKH